MKCSSRIGLHRLPLFILSQVLSGSALTLVMGVERGNGYEQWRQLVAREEPVSGAAQVGQLRSLMETTFSGKLE